MTNEELMKAAFVSSWPDSVPLQTRLEITKARLTIAHKQLEAMPLDPESATSQWAKGLYKGDSNGAAAMLRCIDEYHPSVFGSFTEEWAWSILRKNEELIKGISA